MVQESKCWWHSLNEECPITLESLSTLPYPPFSLTTTGSSTSYFDGLALASYIVSRGIFQNPLTREDLTMADCRRLDDYLETYCYDTQLSGGLSSSRKISVTEALALRSSVHVHPAIRDESRARILQSTATAALAGLFVYGNDRQRRHGSRDDPVAAAPTRTVMPPPYEEQLILDWGFDLTRTVPDTATEFASHGWTVIDDDEAMVVATEREAYQATQNAFPPLNQMAPSTGNDLSQGSPLDEHILQRVREISLEEERERLRRQRQLELAQKRLLEQALARREERQRMREQLRTLDAMQRETKKQEQEEIQRARHEIEQWREEQWKKLRLLSEARVANENQRKRSELQVDQTIPDDTKIHDDNVDGAVASQDEVEVDLSAAKKAKAAEKRKRAKQRKKEQKAEERLNQQNASKEQEEAAKKAASALKCGECGEGILDGGFEKYGRKFCSTKCARNAQPSR